jgi:acetolactate synthase regulatory subunit
MYCTELATTALVPQTDALMNSLQEYVSMSVTPHVFGAVEPPLPSSLGSLDSQEEEYLNSDQFSSLPVASPLDSGTTGAQTLAPGLSEAGFVPPVNLNRYAPSNFNESLGSSGMILKEEEPYYPWTATGNLSFFDYEFDTDIDVEKTMFDSLDSKEATKSLSSIGVMSPCKWDPDTLEPKEVVLAAAVPDFPASSLEHSSHTNSVSLPAQNAEDLLVLLAGTKPHDQSASKSMATVTPQMDRHISTISHLLESVSSYGTPQAEVKTAEQETPSIDPFYLQQSTDMSFTQNLPGWPHNGTNPLMDMHSKNLVLPVSHFQHSHQSFFQRQGCSKLEVPAGHARPARQSLFMLWTEKIVPMIKEEAQKEKLAEQELARSCPSSGETVRPNPANDEAAHVHKLAERCRRSKFNDKLQTLCTLVPIIKKKDRVSVLTHTIDYIHQLKTQVTQLEKAAGPLLKQEKGIDYSQPPASTMSEEFSTLSSSSRSPIKVAVSPNEDGLVINVEASNHTETLVRILSVSRDLGLEIRSFNSKSINDQVQVAVNVVVQGVHEMSSRHVQEALWGVLVASDSSLSPITSDHLLT